MSAAATCAPALPDAAAAPAAALPRIGFLGLGWIGQHRMQALQDAGACRVAALADPSPEAVEQARLRAPEAAAVGTLDQLLALELDAVVIATPSALHARQAMAALRRGLAVFCQKPLARSAGETAEMVSAARSANRLLGCDFSYRHTEGMRRIRDSVRRGELGPVYAADLVFHNAYGPDKPWFRDAALSGGGCAIDLGIHLVDLALWTLDFPEVERASSRLFAKGRRLAPGSMEVEDFAFAQLDLAGGAVVRIACSWNLAAGCDAVIGAEFHGPKGGAALRNQGGSFYDFSAERFEGRQRHLLCAPPDAWGGRAIVAWARALAAGAGYDDEIEQAVRTAAVMDTIYGR